jgi:carbon monoxide dehydrogenase subunit G
MKLNRKTTVNRDAQKVWKVLAHDFDKAGEWMSAVPKSHKIIEGDSVEDSPMVGRVCELSTKADGPFADERITYYNEENMELHIRVVPKNGKIPVKENNVVMKVKSVGVGQSEVSWSSDIDLKTVGKVLYPMLKMGLTKAFNELLEELKYFVEEGKPHPRKLAKINNQAA